MSDIPHPALALLHSWFRTRKQWTRWANGQHKTIMRQREIIQKYERMFDALRNTSK